MLEVTDYWLDSSKLKLLVQEIYKFAKFARFFNHRLMKQATKLWRKACRVSPIEMLEQQPTELQTLVQSPKLNIWERAKMLSQQKEEQKKQKKMQDVVVRPPSKQSGLYSHDSDQRALDKLIQPIKDFDNSFAAQKKEKSDTGYKRTRTKLEDKLEKKVSIRNQNEFRHSKTMLMNRQALVKKFTFRPPAKKPSSKKKAASNLHRTISNFKAPEDTLDCNTISITINTGNNMLGISKKSRGESADQKSREAHDHFKVMRVTKAKKVGKQLATVETEEEEENDYRECC